ncbi:sigma-54-dependent transcriptional regulator [Propionivibrio sp.]|uniref:sigma-54-dependent transcriptional regulator n=1 Tax=Propionivibrio sp. TaxID=2212460 RepID=UPI003BF1A213
MAQGLPILVVEDDPHLREAVCDTLELAGLAVVSAPGGEEALKLLEAQSVALVVSDVRMMPMDGIALLKEIRSRFPHLPVVLMTAYAEVDRAVEAMRSGACDFLLKPFEPKALLEHVARYRLPEAMDDDRVVANDPVTRNLFALATRVAQTDTTVLLTGESGVGKEIVARYIHNHSARRSGPFVAINCAAIPDSLLESTLFGYEKGAFTGAQQAQAGKFEQAQNGTLLLDEVTEMPLGLQAKLLRVLQEREVERVGGKKPVALNIRIIATSNRDIADAVAKGVFREDVYYRLNVFPLLIPALRQRREDIVPLAQHFLAEHGGRSGRTGLRLAPSSEDALRSHSWPGNVRELENVMQRAVIFAAGEVVAVDELHLTASLPLPAPPSRGTSPDAPCQASSGLPPDGQKTDTMRDFERERILETLAAMGGSRQRTCERLGIPERTLRYKLQQYRDAGFYKK